MDRVNRILHHEKYKDYAARIEKAEKERQFCRHNMGHFLDVARLAVILDQTEGYSQEKELIYGAALLHDIGRWMEYEDDISHEKASAMLAPEILDNCGFSEEEKSSIGDDADKKIFEDEELQMAILNQLITDTTAQTQNNKRV